MCTHIGISWATASAWDGIPCIRSYSVGHPPPASAARLAGGTPSAGAQLDGIADDLRDIPSAQGDMVIADSAARQFQLRPVPLRAPDKTMRRAILCWLVIWAQNGRGHVAQARGPVGSTWFGGL